MLIRSFYIVIFVCISQTLSAQMVRTIYQTFEIDSAATVQLDLVGFTEVQIEAWAGNSVLTEVTIQLWDASVHILDHFVKEGRYLFEDTKSTDFMRIATQTRERRVIKTKTSGPNGCMEIITAKIFVPDNYLWNTDIEGDSDGTLKEQRSDLLVWKSGFSGQEESFADRNKHKLLKSLTIKTND